MTPEQTIRRILPGPDADAVLEALPWLADGKPTRLEQAIHALGPALHLPKCPLCPLSERIAQQEAWDAVRQRALTPETDR